MTSERPVNPRLDEDLRLEAKPGGPPRYRSTTDQAVEYVTVIDPASGAVLGYLWAGDEEDAAGWVTRKAGGPPAFNEGVVWSIRLHDAKERGIRPTEALAELTQEGGAGGTGRILPGSRKQAPNAATVKALADEA